MTKETQFLNNNVEYAILPLSLMVVKEVSPAAKMIYMIMANDYLFYKGERGYYAPSNEGLSKDTGLSVSTVKRALANLTEIGLIAVVLAKKNVATHYEVFPVEKVFKEKRKEYKQRITKQVIEKKEIEPAQIEQVAEPEIKEVEIPTTEIVDTPVGENPEWKNKVEINENKFDLGIEIENNDPIIIDEADDWMVVDPPKGHDFRAWAAKNPEPDYTNLAPKYDYGCSDSPF